MLITDKIQSPKRRRLQRTIAGVAALTLFAAACGSDDAAEPEPVVAEAEVEAPVEEPAEAPVEEPAEAPVEEPAEAPVEEPEVDAIIAAFDANGDGTVTIGVAAAGPRDDNGYYQSLYGPAP